MRDFSVSLLIKGQYPIGSSGEYSNTYPDADDFKRSRSLVQTSKFKQSLNVSSLF